MAGRPPGSAGAGLFAFIIFGCGGLVLAADAILSKIRSAAIPAWAELMLQWPSKSYDIREAAI